jgi:hypothetical protein
MHVCSQVKRASGSQQQMGAAGSVQPHECKLFLVQELCNVSLSAALQYGALHNPTTHRPEMVS